MSELHLDEAEQRKQLRDRKGQIGVTDSDSRASRLRVHLLQESHQRSENGLVVCRLYQ